MDTCSAQRDAAAPLARALDSFLRASPGLPPGADDDTLLRAMPCRHRRDRLRLPPDSLLGRRDHRVPARPTRLSARTTRRPARTAQLPALDRHPLGYSLGPARLGGATSHALDVPLRPPPRHSPTSLQTVLGARGTTGTLTTLARPSEMRRRHRLAHPTPSSAHHRGRRPGRTTIRAPGLFPVVTDATTCCPT